MACAKRILSWIYRERSAASPAFTGRECFQALRGSYPRMASISAGLSVLKEQFYSIPPEPGKSGGIYSGTVSTRRFLVSLHKTLFPLCAIPKILKIQTLGWF